MIWGWPKKLQVLANKQRDLKMTKNITSPGKKTTWIHNARNFFYQSYLVEVNSIFPTLQSETRDLLRPVPAYSILWLTFFAFSSCNLSWTFFYLLSCLLSCLRCCASSFVCYCFPCPSFLQQPRPPPSPGCQRTDLSPRSAFREGL